MYNFRAIGRSETAIIDAKRKQARSLDLRSCFLTSVPPAVYTDGYFSSSLTCLDLSNNQLEELPPQFWSLVSLETLNLRYNQLKCIDKSLQALVKLEVLDLSHNLLKNVPPGLVSLKNLKLLNLSSNCITHFDRSILLLQNLKKLTVSRNPLKNLTSELCCANITTLRKHYNLQSNPSTPKRFLENKKANFLQKTPEKCKLSLSSRKSDHHFRNQYQRNILEECQKLDPVFVQNFLVTNGKCQLLIPDHKSVWDSTNYKISVINDRRFHPSCLDDRTVLASPVVAVSPHGVQFPEETAKVSLPISVSLSCDEDIVCLYSDTDLNETPNWTKCPKSSFQVDSCQSNVVINTKHFSLFCAILSKPYPEASVKMCSTVGGDLCIPDVPGVHVSIPESALSQDAEVSMKVLFTDGEYGKDHDHESPHAIATPVLQLEPSGMIFNKPVLVTLPIPDCQDIADMFEIDPEQNLTIWCAETEKLKWQKVEVQYRLNRGDDGMYTITFPVRHFSWYRALWNCMAKTVYKAKLGCAHYYPSIQFSMMCKAMLDYQPGSSSFGIEILCYRSDQEAPEPANLKTAGGSLKPRMVKSGDLIVKLKSSCFEADVENGETRELMKYEFNFKGYEFEKQFACLDVKLPKNRGIFGKVFVERLIDKDVSEPLFEFNLTKKEVASDSWSVVAIKELASILNVDNDIGLLEMSGKLAVSLNAGHKGHDGLTELLTEHQSRGGTSDKFVEVMYEVARSLRGCDVTTGSPKRRRYQTRSQRTNSRPGTPDDDMVSLLADPPGTPGPFDDLLSEISQSRCSTPKRRRPDDVIDGCAILPSKRQCVAADDVNNSVMTSEDNDVREDEKLCNDKTEFEDRRLWILSEGILHKWKLVARTLDLSEIDVVCLEQRYGSDCRECAYQMLLTFRSQYPEHCTFGGLYQRLRDCGLRLVAQKYCVKS